MSQLFVNNFQKRFISSILLLSFSILSFYFGKITFNIFISICTFFIFFEICDITFKKGDYSFYKKILFSFLSSIVPLLFFFDYKIYLFIVIILLLASFFEKKSRLIRVITFTYVFLSLISFQELLKLSYIENDFNNILFILSIVIATDIGAFFFGKYIGGKKIIPNLSPNKTWSGSISGIIISIIVSFFFYNIFELSIIYLMLVSFFLSIFAQLGDIAESFFKRYHNIKDSGFLIPGHGGFFDRFDSLLSGILCYYIIINFVIG